MGSRAETSTSSANRKPLGDASLRANIGATPSCRSKATRPSNSAHTELPHHESITANGTFMVQNTTETTTSKHNLAKPIESQDESKRDSQVSTTSTNASAKGRKRKTHIGPWQLGPDIGKGGCGKVRKVKHSVTGEVAAAKIISKKVAERARAESLMSLVEHSKKTSGMYAMTNIMPFGIEREIAIMKLLEHPNVVKLYDLWENRDEIYLIMEYVDGGELFEYVDKSQYLEDDETVYLFRQIVAALLHCHRLGIHHRDLKPENILLEKATMQVKLVDFGMAALQPQGKLLTTPCGSVHYAAPEVFEKNYDGNKVDVWSLGVLLYVMLTGTIPFDYKAEYVHNVLPYVRVLKSGQFYTPENLSKEAKDLIKRMLVPDPRARISLEDVWKHPFIHKYEVDWKEPHGSGNIDHWIGPAPVISNWNVKTKKDIDREIFRNLKTLWHSERESTLIEKLLSPQPNQEKFFYFALKRYQEEQLENYSDYTDGVPYSTSDHHHLRRFHQDNLVQLPPIPSSAYVRTKSSYSILDEEKKPPKSNLRDHPPSVGSYDPYRASNSALLPANGTFSITVHRKAGGPAHHSDSQQQTSLRVEALRNQQSLQSSASGTNASSAKLRPASTNNHTLVQRNASRSSSGQATLHKTPPATNRIQVKPSHKQRVNFSHLRRSSTASALSRESTSVARIARGSSTFTLNTKRVKEFRERTSPIARRSGAVISRKETQQSNPTRLIDRIDSEARKVSNELEKFCEHVFYGPTSRYDQRVNRTSANEAQVMTSTSSTQNPHKDSQFSQARDGSIEAGGSNGTVQPETPNSYVSRELAQTRERIAARFAKDENISQNSTYREILAQLDALLAPGHSNSSGKTNRISSAPTWNLDTLPSLPIISEEDKSAESELGIELARQGRRSATAPSAPCSASLQHPQSTIRVVGQESPYIEPLVIRKTSGKGPEFPGEDVSSPHSAARYYSKIQDSPLSQNNDSAGPTSSIRTSTGAISGDDCRGKSSNKLFGKKKWFRRRISPGEALLKKQTTHREPQVEFTSQFVRNTSDRESSVPSVKSDTTRTDHTRQPFSEKRPGFLRFFTRRKGSEHPSIQFTISMEEDERLSDCSPSLPDSSTSTTRIVRSRGTENRNLEFGVQRSWLARIFHIKPISALLCFQVGRGKARQEVVRLLKSWRMYGVRDVVLDRAQNLVYGRLANTNSLGIKEVSFVAELFVVLQHGRRAQLSMARFTQRSGAASSFKRIVETLEEVLAGRGLLILDQGKKKEIEAILKGST